MESLRVEKCVFEFDDKKFLQKEQVRKTKVGEIK